MGFSMLIGNEGLDRQGKHIVECFFDFSGCIERFSMPVSFWARSEYIKNWKKSISYGLLAGRDSVIITSMRDPESANFIFVWVFYYSGDKSYVQNKVLFLDELTEGFNLDNINDYVGQRNIFNEDGERISEWFVSTEEVIDCFEMLS